MYALVDCNSFFCSVEKVFHPGLDGRPVCVLSNNDGCIVALTPEAKQVGLHRGDPIFKVQGIVKRYGVEVFSGNLMLYAAMSKRIVSILRKSVPKVEQYSIDECFCDLGRASSPAFPHREGANSLIANCVDTTDYRNSIQYNKIERSEASSLWGRTGGEAELMRSVANKIKTFTDIPVSVGIAPSKTLAKMGSKFAKKYKGYRSVCAIDTEEKRRKALELFDLSDVWGIGRQTLEKLNYYGIQTPLEFAEKSESWVRGHFTKPGIQTWMELNGIPCIDTTELKQNKSICTSRSFGDMISDLDTLKESVSTFASSCANKLRAQNAGACVVTVFIATNRFRTDLLQYFNSANVRLVTPTADTLEINKAAMVALESIYVPGIWYKKSGVVVSDIHSMNGLQWDLFDPVRNRLNRERLMKSIDSLNHRYGLKTVCLGTATASPSALPHREGTNSQKANCVDTNVEWRGRSEHRSPNYLTNLDEILEVKV